MEYVSPEQLAGFSKYKVAALVGPGSGPGAVRAALRGGRACRGRLGCEERGRLQQGLGAGVGSLEGLQGDPGCGEGMWRESRVWGVGRDRSESRDWKGARAICRAGRVLGGSAVGPGFLGLQRCAGFGGLQ